MDVILNGSQEHTKKGGCDILPFNPLAACSESDCTPNKRFHFNKYRSLSFKVGGAHLSSAAAN